MGNNLCSTGNVVPVVVPGLSSSTHAMSSCISFPQDLSSTSASRERVRSDDTYDQALGDRGDLPKKKALRTTIKQREIDLRDLPEWMEEFRDNLEDTDVLAPTHISYYSDSEGPMKVAPRKRSY